MRAVAKSLWPFPPGTVDLGGRLLERALVPARLDCMAIKT